MAQFAHHPAKPKHMSWDYTATQALLQVPQIKSVSNDPDLDSISNVALLETIEAGRLQD